MLRKFLALARTALPLVILACGVLGTIYAFKTTRERERSRVIEETMETIKERDAIDGEINSLDLPDLCARLGGKWVSGTCE